MPTMTRKHISDEAEVIRSAIKQALSNPLVYGMLPASDVAGLAPILKTDVKDWTYIEYERVRKTFAWAAQNC
jgi:hypothetical protein